MKPAVFITTLVFMSLVYPLVLQAEEAVPIELLIVSSKTLSGTAGDFVIVEGEIANNSDLAVNNITTYLSLVNTDTRMPVDLEDWSAERGLFISMIDARQAFPLTWKIHFVQAGNYALAIVANIEGNDKPITSSLVFFQVFPKMNLNPGNVLPVVFGMPILLVFGFLILKYWRDKRYRQ